MSSSIEPISSSQNGAAEAGASPGAQLGFPRSGLAAPAAANTLDASLVAAQFGVSRNLMAGVTASTPSGDGSVFSSSYTLQVLKNLPMQNADQALALLGMTSPASTNGTA